MSRKVSPVPTVKGEEGTEQTCEILMEKLNHDGGEWVRVESPTSLDWIDGFLHSESNENRPASIQVTKAYPAIWGELARNPSGVSKNRDVNEIRQTLMEAIEKKKSTC